MNEYLSEKEQWELLKGWIRQNGMWIVAGVAAGAVALGGWNWWQGRAERVGVEASRAYEQLLQALEQGDRKRGLALVEQIKRNYSSSPYVDQADLLAARALVEANDLEGAAKHLSGVMTESSDPQLRLVARLRLARVQIAQNKPDAAIATLNVAEPGAFAPRFSEVRGDAYAAKGNVSAALKEYRSARAAGVAAVVDTELLDLKINELTAAEAPAPANASTKSPNAAATPNAAGAPNAAATPNAPTTAARE